MLLKDHARTLSFGLAVMSTSILFFPAIAFCDTAGADFETVYTPLTTQVNWANLGQNVSSSHGTLSPFTRACGIVEGQITTSGDVTTRNVYVLDAGSGSTSSVVLNVFSKTDTITTSNGSSTDTVAYTLTQQVTLSLVSQAGAACYMAANDVSVFVGTNANNFASVVNKSTLAETTLSSILESRNDPVTQITATSDGKVLITFGTGLTSGWVMTDDQTSTYIWVGGNYNPSVFANAVNGVTF